jgi:hypothetical protein
MDSAQAREAEATSPTCLGLTAKWNRDLISLVCVTILLVPAAITGNGMEGWTERVLLMRLLALWLA